jgi:hypothetical protein
MNPQASTGMAVRRLCMDGGGVKPHRIPTVDQPWIHSRHGLLSY